MCLWKAFLDYVRYSLMFMSEYLFFKKVVVVPQKQTNKLAVVLQIPLALYTYEKVNNHYVPSMFCVKFRWCLVQQCGIHSSPTIQWGGTPLPGEHDPSTSQYLGQGSARSSPVLPPHGWPHGAQG